MSNRQPEAWGGDLRLPRWLRRVLRRPEPLEPTPEAEQERKKQAWPSGANADGSALAPMTEIYRDAGAGGGKRR